MSKPSFKSRPGIYLFTWEPEQVAMRLDHLDESRSVVTAELTVENMSPGVPKHIHQARFNLLSTSALTSLAKYLAQRRDDLDWAGMLEQAGVITLREYRRGEPAVRVGSLPPREGLVYRIKPLLQEKQPTLLFGDGGTGKSTLARYLAVLLDGCVEHNGLWVEPGHVLYLDYETDYHSFLETVEALRKGLSCQNDPDIFYRFCSRSFVEEVEEIQRICLENDIEVLFVDSLGMAAGKESTNEDVPIRGYFTALRSLKLTSLTIDHVNKEGGLYGNRYKWNMARSVFEAKSAGDTPGNSLVTGLYHRKLNHGRKLSPLGFSFTWSENDTCITVAKEDVKAIPDLAAHMSIRLQIRSILQTYHKMTVKEIVSELSLNGKEINEQVVRNKLNDGQKANEFVKLGEQWALKSREPDGLNR